MKKIVISTIIMVFVMSLGSLWMMWERFVNHPMSDLDQEIVYEIAPGLSFRAVAKDLQKQGLIRNADFFVLLAKIQGGANKMKIGEYALNKKMSAKEVLAVILSGKSIERKLTVAEGLNIFDVSEIFEVSGLGKKEEVFKTLTDKEFIKSLLGEEHGSLEGYLFPETYSFTKYTDYKTILTEMVGKFKSTYKQIEQQAKALGFSRHQVATLASIIEKETGAPEERALISSVFHNRLSKGMMLQTDPTILYGKAMKNGHMEIKISKADLTTYTPYNTYMIKSLPPGPIANPSKEALFAAVRPASSKYLYFVSHNDGTHQFSEDFKAHNKAVQKFQVDPHAREGKSWRNLKKKKH